MTRAIYIRTSTEDQKPENQIKDCESLFEGKYDLYKDQQSAWKDNVEREDFNKLITEIRRKRIKKLYVWDLDRIYRNRKKLLEFFRMCKMKGCAIYSFRQRFLNDIQELNLPEGFGFLQEMMIDNFLHFLGWMAEDESEKKSARVRAAIRIKDDGAYSYKGNKWGRKRVSTQKLNKIKTLYAENPKISMRVLAKEVNLSKSVVHKYLAEFKEKNMDREGMSLTN